MSRSRTFGRSLGIILLVGGCTTGRSASSDAAPIASDVAPAVRSGVPPTASAAPSVTVDSGADGCVHVHFDAQQAGSSTVEGTIRREERKVNGSRTMYLFIVLPKAVCIVGSPEVKETKEIQLTTRADMMSMTFDLEKRVGKRVRVTGAGYTGQFRSDQRPILLSVTSFADTESSTKP